MTDETLGYAQAKGQLDEIVSEVRRKDVSLEKSLELLEEGVRLANRCTELIDQAAWDDMAVDGEDADTKEEASADGEKAADAPAEEPTEKEAETTA